MAKIYNTPSVSGTGLGCRVTTHSVRIPVSIMNLVVRSLEPDLATYKRRKFRAFTMMGWEGRTGRGIDDQ